MCVGSNCPQWKMITDALEAGATIYDLRGITEGLEEDDPHLGLIQFKVGTGARRWNTSVSGTFR